MRIESLVVAAGRSEAPGAPINAPLELTTSFRNDGAENLYARTDLAEPRASLESALGALEGGTALVFASGMAAVAAVVDGLAAGSVAVIPDTGYSGSLAIFARAQELGRITTRPVDIGDTDAVLAALDGADLLWLETTSNALMTVPDLPALIDAAHAGGAIVGVDATFTTPLNLRALDLGADVVMHSATKYLAGHSDALFGVLATKSSTLATDLAARRTLAGSIPGALESFLALRGLRTLALRWERAQANAGELARRLVEHPKVTRVRYLGLPDDPGHDRASKLFAGYGAMISFEVAGTDADAEQVCRRVELITHATSLGGVESLIERRARHAIDAGFGTPPTLLRLSVGIEHVEDLWDDLAQALGG